MTIPYQPTYSLQPKYGFRYGPSSFAPPQAPIAPPPVGLQGSPATPPPVMGTQQGTAAPAYTQDPLQAGGDLQNQQAEAYNQARINQAQSYGYTQGVQNPAGIVRAVPVVGNFMADSLNMGQDSKYTYGDPGTYDAQGNVFADKGRAYDPITGAPAQSYTKMTGENSWLGNAYGVGTEGGLFGSDSGYGKLRAAGESPVSSFLGSYDNSIYKQMDMDPSIKTIEGARAARRRGGNSPIENLANTITQNTINAKTDEFGNIPTGPVWGTQPGDYVQSDQGPLMVNDSGQMQNPQGGTTVMIDGVSFVNANISKGTKTEFKGTPFEREVPLSQEQFDIISDRTSPTPAPGSPESVASVLSSLDPSKNMTSEETTSISDIISGTGMTPASFKEEGDGGNNNSSSSSSSSSSSKPSAPSPSSPANPANYNNKDGLTGGNTGGGNNSSPSGSACCFIMLEARYGNGAMDKVVRKYRDDHMTQKNRRGYYKVAEVLVPLMRKSKVFKWIITKTFADPLVSYGKWYYGENKHGWIFAPIKSMWLKLFDIVGTDTVFIRENGEEV